MKNSTQSALIRSLPLAAVLAIAAAVRAALTWSHYNHPLFTSLRLDEVEYQGYARDLIASGLFLDYVPIHAPGYFYLLAAAYSLAGDIDHQRLMLVPRLIQAAMGIGAALVVHRIARRLFGPGPALISATIIALYWPLMIFEQRLLATSLFLFVVLLSLHSALAAEDKGGALRWALTGFVTGLAVLVRPTAAPWLVALAVWLVVRAARKREPGRMLHALSLVAAAALAVSPVIIHNHALTGEWRLIQRNGGLNFYVGNNPESNGSAYARPGRVWDAIDALPATEAGITDESKRDRFYVKKILGFMAEDPGGFARLQAIKALMIVNRFEARSTIDPAFHRELFHPLKLPLPGFGVIMTLAAPGILALKKMDGKKRLLVIFVAMNWLAVVSTIVASRYRVAFTAGLVTLAGAGFFVLLGAAGEVKRWIVDKENIGRGVAAPFGLAAIGLALCLLPVAPRYDDSEELAYLGEAHIGVGQVDLAADCYHRARDINAESHLALMGLARIEMIEGDMQGALDYAGQAVDADPDSAAAGLMLAEVWWRMGERDKAIALLDREVAKRPGWVKGLYALAVFHAETGDLARARKLLAEIREIKSNFSPGVRFLEAIGEKPAEDEATR